MAAKKTSKEEVYWKVLNAVLELDFRKGHQKWTLSDLSRKSGVTRSLIYYYFGRSKIGLLREAVALIGSDFMGMRPERLKLWQDGKISESVLISRKLLVKSPHLGAFYMSHRNRDGEIGDSLRELEKKYIGKLVEYMPNRDRDLAYAIMGLFFGLVIAPGIPDKVVSQTVDTALGLLKSPVQ